MEQTLQDLADLVFAALPTTLLVVILWLFLKAVLINPLLKVMAERDAATKGAIEQANAALRRAEERAAEHESALRAARGEILRAQDAERQKLRHEQAEALAAARARSAEMLENARKEISDQADSAKATLAKDSERLAGEIAAAVLRRGRN